VDIDDIYANIIQAIFNPYYADNFLAICANDGLLRIVHDKFMVIREQFNNDDTESFRLTFKDFVIKKMRSTLTCENINLAIVELSWYNGKHADKLFVEALKNLSSVNRDSKEMISIYKQLVMTALRDL
jgi:hypothetical protein